MVLAHRRAAADRVRAAQVKSLAPAAMVSAGPAPAALVTLRLAVEPRMYRALAPAALALASLAHERLGSVAAARAVVASPGHAHSRTRACG